MNFHFRDKQSSWGMGDPKCLEEGGVLPPQYSQCGPAQHRYITPRGGGREWLSGLWLCGWVGHLQPVSPPPPPPGGYQAIALCVWGLNPNSKANSQRSLRNRLIAHTSVGSIPQPVPLFQGSAAGVPTQSGPRGDRHDAARIRLPQSTR